MGKTRFKLDTTMNCWVSRVTAMESILAFAKLQDTTRHELNLEAAVRKRAWVGLFQLLSLRDLEPQ